MNYNEVQNIAKATMQCARTHIRAGMTLAEVRARCEQKMVDLGATSFWYWDVGAFVFAGDETTRSVSGREYVTADRVIAENDIITVDLSPQVGDTWGDYARTLIVQDGSVVEDGDVRSSMWKHGIDTEILLHEKMRHYVTPDTTFEELYTHINREIEAMGYVNLDFLGNLGHSIVRRKQDRVYIEKGNQARLGDVAYFTFEPHISRPGSPFGFKRENIYYFDNCILTEL